MDRQPSVDGRPRPAERDRQDAETVRKRDIALATLAALIQFKLDSGGWGRVEVHLTFQDGHIKTVETRDVTTVQDAGPADAARAAQFSEKAHG